MAEFIAAKLNVHLQSQIINIKIGSVSKLMTRTLEGVVTKINYQELTESNLLAVFKEKILGDREK